MSYKITESLDELLVLLLSYPKTLVYLVFTPKKVVGDNAGIFICPPGIFLTISFILFYLSGKAISAISYNEEFILQEPSENYLILGTIFSAMILVIQYNLVNYLLKLEERDDNDIINNMKILSYSLSVGLAIYAIIIFSSLVFKEVALNIAWRFDTDAFNPNSKFQYTVPLMSFYIAQLFYLLSLYEIIRIRYKTTFLRGIFVSFVFFIIMQIIFLSVFLILSIITENIKELSRIH